MKYSIEVFNILSKGKFLNQGSTDPIQRAAYDDISDNIDEYTTCYRNVGFDLIGADGYYYFSRKESAKDIESKLIKWAVWIDILACLVAYDKNICVGATFVPAQIEARALYDEDLSGTLNDIYSDKTKTGDKITQLCKDMESLGYIEMINKDKDTYMLMPAFDYLVRKVNAIIIKNEETEDDNE